MEWKLYEETMRFWEKSVHTVLYQEETSEMIVPDACPDMLCMVAKEGKVCVQTRSCSEGKGEISGLVKVSMVYRGEGGEICPLEGILPFKTSLDSGKITKESRMFVKSTIQRLEIIALNPRKILMKVNFSLDVSIHSPKTQRICTRAEGGCDIAQKIVNFDSYVTTGTCEKPFQYADVISIPAGCPDMKKLLHCRLSCDTEESKVIGSKVVIKGEGKVEVLYLSVEDKYSKAVVELPFSQIVEWGEGEEDVSAEVSILFTDYSYHMVEGSARDISLVMELVSQCSLEKQEHRELLTDIYSTKEDGFLDYENYASSRLMDYGSSGESHQETVETIPQPEKVLDSAVSILGLKQRRQGEDLVLVAEVLVDSLFETSEGEVESFQHKATVSHTVAASSKWDYEGNVQLSREALVRPISGGLDISFSLGFSWKAVETGATVGLSHVNFEERPKKELPSVVLRGVAQGESLWDIAKTYGVLEENLITLNGLETESIYPGQMLMIGKL